jgi:hypothetical protein
VKQPPCFSCLRDSVVDMISPITRDDGDHRRSPESPLLVFWGGIKRDGGDLQLTIFFNSAIWPE